MTIQKLCVPLLVAVLAGCQGSSPPAATATPAPAPAAAVVPAPTADSADATEATAIPDSAVAIWQAIDQKSAQLKATIASGELDDVHHQAYAIRDLVAALPAKTTTLNADDQSKLQNDVKFVATLAGRLDASGDAGDRAAAQADFDKLVAVLGTIPRGQ